jgi:hypothetical protein
MQAAQSKTRTARNWKEQRQLLHSSIAWVSESRGIRAFDAVVIEINRFGAGAPRSIVLKTGGAMSRAADSARCQRLCRRLRLIGVKFTTSLSNGRECDGVFGTMFAYKLTGGAA